MSESIQAISGDDQDSIDLLDDRGCPTDPVIFPGLQQIEGANHKTINWYLWVYSEKTTVFFSGYTCNMFEAY